jgi:ribose transport system substrate-binding protein
VHAAGTKVMKSSKLIWLSVMGAVGFSSCDRSGGGKEASEALEGVKAGKFVIIDTKTDDADPAAAKKNAENSLLRYPDLDGMVGLWSYNAPACLEAAKDANRAGEVKIFSFDEDAVTVQGIKDGMVEGTIVQQPYEFGYQSVAYLKKIADGEEFEVPENKEISIPAKTITKDNVEDFEKKLAELRELGKQAEGAPKKESELKFAFVINNPDPFWSYARAGCFKAEQDFGVACDFETPPSGKEEEQNKILENIIQKGDYDGVAISPLDPANQGGLIDEVAAKLPLICHDSDAPESSRRFYLGTNNYDAGRLLGKLVKERMPEGGSLMIFVGKSDALNAQQRRQGLIDELGAE